MCVCVCQMRRSATSLPFSEQLLSFSSLLAFSFSYLPSNGSLLVFFASSHSLNTKRGKEKDGHEEKGTVPQQVNSCKRDLFAFISMHCSIVALSEVKSVLSMVAVVTHETTCTVVIQPSERRMWVCFSLHS